MKYMRGYIKVQTSGADPTQCHHQTLLKIATIESTQVKTVLVNRVAFQKKDVAV